jgi:hypothetical protein
MKIKHILFSMALVMAVVACKEESFSVKDPMITTSQAVFTMENTAAGTIQFTVCSNMPWHIVVSPGNATSKVNDIRVTPTSGEASLRPVPVTVTFGANKDLKRDAVISIITDAAGAAVRLSQPGDNDPKEVKGSRETPYKPMDLVKDYNSGNVKKGEVLYVRGIVYKVVDLSPKKEDGSGYGNATFWISDDGTAPADDNEAFEVYRAKDFGLADITNGELLKVGDLVTVYGPVTNYNKTVETDQNKAQIIAVNGVGSPFGAGTDDLPYNVGMALNRCYETGTTATEELLVKGVICKIKEISLSNGNATYWISDDGYMPESETSVLQIFRGKWFGGESFTSEDQLKVGDEVVVKGALIHYNEKTPEVNTGSQIVLLNGETEKQ